MMRIVLTSVLPLRLKPGAYFNSQLWSHGHISEIEQLVQVRAQ